MLISGEAPRTFVYQNGGIYRQFRYHGYSVFVFPSMLWPLTSLLQELEMQARAHGLAISSSALCSSDLGPRSIKQEPTLDDCHQDLYSYHLHHQHHPDCTPEPPGTLEPNEGHSNYPESHYSSAHNKAGSKLNDILMEDTISPVRGGDPLLSSVSPDTSKDSSRKSSVSMDENEQGC